MMDISILDPHCTSHDGYYYSKSTFYPNCACKTERMYETSISSFYGLGVGCCSHPANLPADCAKSVAKLQKASCIYEKESAAGSPEKDVTGSRKFKVVAAEVDSQKALSHGLVLVGAPLEKRVALIVLSMRIANVPVTSSSLSARLAGNWASIFMFRRCLICLLSESYSFGSDCEKTTAQVFFELPRSTAEELMLSSVFALVAVSNVRAACSPVVYATDAPVQRGAVTARPVSPDIARMLIWLGGDKKGTYTALDPPFRALRRSFEIDLEELEEENDKSPAQHVPASLEFQFSFVEVCGVVGSVSKALAARGRPVMAAIELSDSPRYDIRELRLVEWLCHMLESRKLRSIMVEPVCATFSSAAHPAVRSYAEVWFTSPEGVQDDWEMFRYAEHDMQVPWRTRSPQDRGEINIPNHLQSTCQSLRSTLQSILMMRSGEERH